MRGTLARVLMCLLWIEILRSQDHPPKPEAVEVVYRLDEKDLDRGSLERLAAGISLNGRFVVRLLVYSARTCFSQFGRETDGANYAEWRRTLRTGGCGVAGEAIVTRRWRWHRLLRNGAVFSWFGQPSESPGLSLDNLSWLALYPKPEASAEVHFFLTVQRGDDLLRFATSFMKELRGTLPELDVRVTVRNDHCFGDDRSYPRRNPFVDLALCPESVGRLSPGVFCRLGGRGEPLCR